MATEIRLNSLLLKDKITVLTSCMNNDVLPILQYIKCDVIGSKMTMTSSNLEVSIRTTVDVLSGKDITFLLNKDAITIIKKIKDEDFMITIEEDTFNAIIKASTGKYKTTYISHAEFPEVPTTDGASKVYELPYEMLRQGLKKSLPFTGDDELRPIMNSVFIHNAKGLLKMVATTGHLLSSFNTGITITNDVKIVFPKTAVKSIEAYTSKDNAIIALDKGGKKIIVLVNDIQYFINGVEGTYPAYQSIIPVPTSEIKLSKKALQACLENLAIMMQKDSGLMTIQIKENELYLEAQDLDFAKSGDATVAMTHVALRATVLEHERCKIGVNLTLVQEILKQFSSDNVSIYLTGKNNVIFKTDNSLDPVVLSMLMMTL